MAAPRLISALALLVSPPATPAAAPTTLAAELHYVAVSGCPPPEGFSALVANHLGYDPFHPRLGDQTRLREQVVVEIERNGTALYGRLEWRSAAGHWLGERTFPSRTGNCVELIKAMSFSLALQMQLLAIAERQAPAPSPPTPAPTQVEPVPARPTLTLAVGVAGGLGLTAHPVALGRLLGGLAWRRLGLELAADATLPTTIERGDGTAFSQQEISASVAGCRLASLLSACLLVRAGDVRVTGQRIAYPATSHALFLQAGVRVATTHRLGSRAYAAAHVDALVALTRATVTIDAMPVWTVPWLATLVGIDVGVRFQ